MIALKISHESEALLLKLRLLLVVVNCPNAKQEFRTGQSSRLLKVGLHSGWSRRNIELGSKWSLIFVNRFTWAMLWILFGIFRNLLNFPPPVDIHNLSLEHFCMYILKRYWMLLTLGTRNWSKTPLFGIGCPFPPLSGSVFHNFFFIQKRVAFTDNEWSLHQQYKSFHHSDYRMLSLVQNWFCSVQYCKTVKC